LIGIKEYFPKEKEKTVKKRKRKPHMSRSGLKCKAVPELDFSEYYLKYFAEGHLQWSCISSGT